MAKKSKVKVIRVDHGLFSGNPNTRKIEGTMSKWMGKGFRLDQQRDVDRPGCGRRGYTLLTFVQDAQ